MEMKLPTSKIISHAEEKALDKQLEGLKDIRDEKELMQGVSYEARDRGAVEAKIKELEQIKATHGAPELSAVERDRAFKELKGLEDDLHQGMPTWDEYISLTPKHGARYTALVKKIVQWEGDAVRRQKIARWRTLRRVLDPNDDQADAMLYLFPQSN